MMDKKERDIQIALGVALATKLAPLFVAPAPKAPVKIAKPITRVHTRTEEVLHSLVFSGEREPVQLHIRQEYFFDRQANRYDNDSHGPHGRQRYKAVRIGERVTIRRVA